MNSRFTIVIRHHLVEESRQVPLNARGSVPLAVRYLLAHDVLECMMVKTEMVRTCQTMKRYEGVHACIKRIAQTIAQTRATTD